MNFIRFLLARSGGADHVRVFARFRLALEGLIASRESRPGPRIANPFDWSEE